MNKLKEALKRHEATTISAIPQFKHVPPGYDPTNDDDQKLLCVINKIVRNSKNG